MLESRADIAVHSMKDVPAQQPEGLTLAAFLSGEDPRDAFVSNRFGALAELPADAIVGTSSLRRQAQLRAARPDLVIRDLRGNVGSRSEEHTSELQSLMRISYAVFCLKTKPYPRPYTLCHLA